jgi:DNA polymerase-3 subunit delta'
MWQKIQGHDILVERFRQAFQRRRLTGTFLFVGPPGVGKRRFAFALAKGLLCRKQDNLDPCGECASCKLFGQIGCTDIDFDSEAFLSKNKEKFLSPHPDLYYVFKPPDKKDLPLNALTDLCSAMNKTAFLGGRKVAVIHDADYFNESGANSLLKTLEEPPPDSVLILIGTSTAKQLPTIRSRCRIVRFAPLPPDVLAVLLTEQKLAATPAQAEKIACLAEGSLEKARELADGDIETVRTELTKILSAAGWDAAAAAACINKVIESEKEDAVRRRRLRLVFSLMTEIFYRSLRTGLPPAADALRTVIRQIERVLEAAEQTDRNVSVPLIAESLAVDLGYTR